MWYWPWYCHIITGLIYLSGINYRLCQSFPTNHLCLCLLWAPCPSNTSVSQLSVETFWFMSSVSCCSEGFSTNLTVTIVTASTRTEVLKEHNFKLLECHHVWWPPFPVSLSLTQNRNGKLMVPVTTMKSCVWSEGNCWGNVQLELWTKLGQTRVKTQSRYHSLLWNIFPLGVPS